MKKRKVRKLPFVILLILICGIFGSLYVFKGYFMKGNEDNKPDVLEKEEPKEKVYSTSFTLAGNVLLNGNMWYDNLTDNSYDFENVFEDLNDIMKKSDTNFYFQQSIIGGKDLGASAGYTYNSPNEIVSSLSKVGFNMMSLAGYHSYDKGIAGITNAVKTVVDNKLVYAGVNDTEENRLLNNIIEKKGLKIGLLSYTVKTDEIVQNPFAVDVYSDDLAKKDIENLKEKVDVIMVSIDWSNTNQEVSDEQKRIANYLSELGVDIIVGNTSYTIQPIEKINDTLVCYSLGNLLSGHFAIDSRISAVVDFNLKITKLENERKVSFEDISVLFTYAYNNNNTNYKVMPFTKITNELLNYKSYYEKYKTLLINDSVKIEFYSIGE